jgi:hypothetical protein
MSCNKYDNDSARNVKVGCGKDFVAFVSSELRILATSKLEWISETVE